MSDHTVREWRFYLDDMNGYHVPLFFLVLPLSGLAVARVAERVAQGGHDTPEAVIGRRFARGRATFDRAYGAVADAWALYDDSGDEPVMLEWEERK